MASSLAVKRLVSSNLVPRSMRLIRPATSAPSATRLFNTNAIRDYDDGDGEGRGFDVDRRSGRSVSHCSDDIFSDVFDPFSSSRSVSQILNLMDRFMENPFLAASRGMGGGLRRGWEAKETEDALNLRIEMPGLGKEDVKVAVEQNILIIKGEGDEESGRRYTSRIDLPENIYLANNVKAEMKNGVLKVMIPKVQEEDKKSVREIAVE